LGHPVRRLAEGFHFLEGLRWHDGRLFASDMHGAAVFAISPEGDVERFVGLGGLPSGLGWDAAGRPLVVSMVDQQVMRLDNGSLKPYADLSSYVVGPINDMLVDSEGRAYVGSFGGQLDGVDPLRPTVLCRVDPDGTVVVVADDLHFPNGMVLTNGGRTLVVAETFAARLTAFDRDDDGGLHNRRTWAEFGPLSSSDDLITVSAELAVLPDGIAVDAEDAIWVADAKGHGALRVREGGEIVDFVDTEDLSIYAVAIGGDDGRTLFMSAAPKFGTADPTASLAGVLLTAQVDVPGP
jgi:sugar lactone lactonase YvrE